ncbi:MAG: hypothetical protein JJU42_13320 [Rhodobacteraceae bacterium]|nr:hypothetical protein [Paracoccaceae bacterium]
MIVLGLIFFVLILMVGGISVDLVRHEQKRVQIQSVADRAALAAASLTQPHAIENVVEDYFSREGLLEYLIRVDVAEASLNARDVHIVTRASTPALFTRLIGLDNFASNVVSRAEERIADVEVVMVLDLSNSMNQFNRIENLRIAGETFVDTIYNNADDDRIAVSVVPYTGQVNAGHDLLDYYNTTHRQPYSACALFENNHYSQIPLSQSAELTGAGHFDPWHMHRFTLMSFCPTHPGGLRGSMSTTAFNNYAASQGLTTGDFEPMDVDTAEIMVMQDDPDVLRRRLRSLIADGNTSIEIGMKWAAALLDTSANNIISDMVSDNLINAAFDNRPFEFRDPDTLKAVVLMTDGENWDEWRMANQFKQGPSGVWHSFPRPNNANGIIAQLVTQGANGPEFMWPDKPGAQPASTRLSVRHPSPGSNQGNFFIPDRVVNPMNRTWSHMPDRWDNSCVEYGPSMPNNRRTAFRFYACNNWIIQELDHRELWATFPVRWVGAYLYHYPGIANYWNWIDQRLTASPPGPKDQRLFEICDRLRDEGVRVYAVAFEAPPNGVEAMRRCAFSPNHFFDVNGLQIEQAFRTIAGSIQRLRLTQ